MVNKIEIYRSWEDMLSVYTDEEVIPIAYEELINNFNSMDKGDLYQLLRWVYEEGQHAGASNGYC